MPDEGRRRVVIESVTPQIDGGRFPVKRIVGDTLDVEADVFADGHDEVGAALTWRGPGESDWHETQMAPLGNDRWRASLKLDKVGRYEFAVNGWVDHYSTWQHDLEKKIAAEQDETVDRLIGEQIMARNAADVLASRTQGDVYAVTVDPARAGFSAWYELFPRSASAESAAAQCGSSRAQSAASSCSASRIAAKSSRRRPIEAAIAAHLSIGYAASGRGRSPSISSAAASSGAATTSARSTSSGWRSGPRTRRRCGWRSPSS